jgi:hypothetical protein
VAFPRLPDLCLELVLGQLAAARLRIRSLKPRHVRGFLLLRLLLANAVHGTRRFGRRLSLITRALFSGAVKLSPPAASGKHNRMQNDLTSYRFRPRRTGICRSRWNSSISCKTLRKPSGGNVSSTACGKSRSFVRPMISPATSHLANSSSALRFTAGAFGFSS